MYTLKYYITCVHVSEASWLQGSLILCMSINVHEKLHSIYVHFSFSFFVSVYKLLTFFIVDFPWVILCKCLCLGIFVRLKIVIWNVCLHLIKILSISNTNIWYFLNRNKFKIDLFFELYIWNQKDIKLTMSIQLPLISPEK